MDSWFKVERNIFENGVINHDPHYLAVWIFLLRSAAYKSRQILFNGKPIELKKGQFITSRKSIAEKTNVDEYKVHRILKNFENAQLIEQQTTSKNRLITVLEPASEEKSAQQNALQTHSGCTSAAHQMHTNKKEKKDNKYIRNKYPWKTQSDYEEPTYDLEEYARRSIHLKYEKKSDRQ